MNTHDFGIIRSLQAEENDQNFLCRVLDEKLTGLLENVCEG